MVLIKTATYKEFNEKIIIDLILAIPLLLESFLCCKIVDNFDYDLDHQPILPEWILKMIDKLADSMRLLAKMDYILLTKTL